MVFYYFVIVLLLIAVAVVIYLYLSEKKKLSTYKSDSVANESTKVKELAEKLVNNKFKDADYEAQQIRNSAKQFYEKVKEQYRAQLKDLENRQKIIDNQRKSVEEKEVGLVKKEEDIAETRRKLLINLEKVAQLSKEEAQKVFVEEFEKGLVSYKAKKIRELEKQIQEEAEEKAREMIVDAMQNVAVDYVDEITVSSVEIGSEEIKGKIIGKEGRNIRAFEKVTGVDVIIDESPTAIGLSSYDPVRREIARVTLMRLIKDGRIHPITIEEQYNKAKKEMILELEKAGKELAERANWYDPPAELVPLLGRLKYRRSKGQSLFEHTMEVLSVAEYVARELKADVNLVLKACLLHDIGKVLTTKIKKPHHHISGDIARKYNLPEKLVNAIEAHHEDIEPTSVEAEIVKIADAVSGARPGARKENLEDYVERVENIEKVAYEVTGDKAEDIYAVRAGRELRVIVRPSQVSDDEAIVLAQKVASKISDTGAFPGNVNVVVVREVRAHASSGNT